jgi:hypothetical protein
VAVASQVSGLTSSWPLSLRASSLLSSSPLELHPLSVYEISFIVLFHIAEIALLVKFFFSFFYLPPTPPSHFSISISLRSSSGDKKKPSDFEKGLGIFFGVHHNQN